MQLWLLDIDRFIKLNGVKEVTNPVGFDKGMRPSSDGLFSNEIFGISTMERKSEWAYIDLKKKFIVPKIYQTLKALNRNFEHLIYGTKYFRIENGLLVEDPEGDTGIDFLYKNWEKINFEKNGSTIRDTRVDVLKNHKKNVIFTDKWIVQPAFFRDVNLQNEGGRTKIPEINDMYSSIMRNVALMDAGNNFELLIHSIEGKIEDDLLGIYMLMKEKIEKKSGWIRKFVMASSTDYAARYVITATPYHAQRVQDQKINYLHTGCPLSMVCANFAPFIIWWVKRYLKTRLADAKDSYPIDIGSETVYVKLNDPELVYNDEFIETTIERWINDASTRFNKIEVPIKESDMDKYKLKGKYYMSFSGYRGTDMTMRHDENHVVRPLTWTDILYMAAVDVTSDKHIMVTRYPMLDYFGLYISRIFVISTRQTEPMIVNDTIYESYPVVDLERSGNLDNVFIDSLKVPAPYLPGIDGDFDGDQVTGRGIFSQEANAEAERIMLSKSNLIAIDGKVVRSIGNEASQSLYTMTRFK